MERTYGNDVVSIFSISGASAIHTTINSNDVEDTAELMARDFIESSLIPEVKMSNIASRTFRDLKKDGIAFIVNKVVQLARDYGLCSKIEYGQEKNSYQFWYETE